MPQTWWRELVASWPDEGPKSLLKNQSYAKMEQLPS